jgi:formylglycine-generating enzyme required for sulfatase activity
MEGYEGDYRVYHGGSWINTAATLQTGSLDAAVPYAEMDDLGFRLARNGD